MLKKIFDWLLNTIFPVQCIGRCGTYDTWLCQPCAHKLVVNQPPECPVCRQPLRKYSVCRNCRDKTCLNGLIVLTDYKNVLAEKLVQLMKYQYVKQLGVTAGRLLGQKIKTSLENIADYKNIVPVPLHRRRKNERGFNQSEIIANSASKILDIPCKNNILKRHRYRQPQATLSKKQRLRNLNDAFRADSRLVLSGQMVIIIDDVATTTATLNECAKALKKIGVTKVMAAVIARSHK